MKIIHVADYYAVGTGHPLNNVVERLYRRGHEVEVYTSNLHLKQELSHDKDYPIKIRRFRGFRIGSKAFYPSLIPKLLFQQNPDVIHSWVMAFFSTFVSGWLKPIKKYPLVVSVDFDIAEPRPTLAKKPYIFFYRKIPTSFSNIITTFTSKERDVLIKRFKFDANKVKILPIGVDFERFSSKPKQNLKEKLNLQDKFIILDVCFLLPKKNLEMILKALKLLPSNVVFLHAGGISDINYKQKLDKMIKNLKLEKRVVFLGKVSREEIVAAYHTADVFVQSGFRESFCIPIIEAIASGLPVITTKVGVANDVIENNKTGFIVKNENEIVNKINLLIEDASLRRKIGRNSKEVAKKYEWEVIIDKLEKIYKRVV
jgi:glycosyltransferase involved in cell wall biosynthesis